MRLPRRLDAGIVAVVALILPTLSVLAHPKLPRGGDLLLHFYRLVALDSCIQRGLLYPRWMPDLVYGYGYPLFHFYAPLSTYLGEALHLLGLDFAMAIRMVSALALLGLGLGVYLWGRDALGSSRGGLIAAVAAAYAPFVLSTPLSRGSISDGVALAVVPFAFWSLDRLRRRPTAPRLVMASATLAALFLSHNVTAMISCPILALYAVAAMLEGPGRRKGPYLLAALALGLLLSAFFWYPALADRAWTRLDLFTADTQYDYRENFVALGHLFRFPAPADSGLMNPPGPYHISPFVFLAGGLGLAWAWRVGASHRLRLTSLWLSGLVLLYLSLAPSAWLWARIPLLPVIQFPFRLLGPASVVLALPAASLFSGAVPSGVKRTWAGYLVATFFLLVLIVPSLPILYPLRQDESLQDVTLEDVSRYQQTMGALGTTSAGEYLPKTIEVLPEGPGFAGMDLGAGLGEKLDRSSLPSVAEIKDLGSEPLEGQWHTSSPVAFDAVVRTFFFPGWQAFIDGAPVSIGPASDSGLIQVRVPAGEHRLVVRYGSTAVTRFAHLLSAIGVVLVLGLLCTYCLAGRPPARTVEDNARLSRREAVFFCALGASLLVAKTAYLDRFDNPWRREYDGQLLSGAVEPLEVDLGGRMRLLAAELLPSRLAPGSTAPLVLYWAALQPLEKSYSVSVQVLDDEAHKIAQKEHHWPGGYPTLWWRTGEYNRDEYLLEIDPEAPLEQYRVLVIPYNGEERLLPPPDTAGAHLGGVEVQQVEIVPAD